jgi:hypothetical protein
MIIHEKGEFFKNYPYTMSLVTIWIINQIELSLRKTWVGSVKVTVASDDDSYSKTNICWVLTKSQDLCYTN